MSDKATVNVVNAKGLVTTSYELLDGAEVDVHIGLTVWEIAWGVCLGLAPWVTLVALLSAVVVK